MSNRASRIGKVDSPSPVVRIATMLAGLVLLLAPPAWGQASEGNRSVVAVLLPLSGDFDHLGQQLLDAIRMSFENCPGVTFDEVDSRGDPATARRRVRELAGDARVFAIVGPVGTAEARAAAEEANLLGIPLIALSSDPDVEHIGPYVFRLRVSPQEQARRIARIALEELDLRRFAVLYPDDAFGRMTMRAFVEEVGQFPGRIMAIEPYSPDTTDFTVAVELLLNRRQRTLRGRAFEESPDVAIRAGFGASPADFEALFIADDSENVSLILHFLAFQGVRLGTGVQLLGISSWVGDSLALCAGLVDGALFTQIFHPAMDSLAVQTFVDRYQQAYGRVPTEAEAQVYDGLGLLCRAFSSLPSTPSRSALRSALLASSIPSGLTGPLAFDPQGAIDRAIWLFSAGYDGSATPYTIVR